MYPAFEKILIDISSPSLSASDAKERADIQKQFSALEKQKRETHEGLDELERELQELENSA